MKELSKLHSRFTQFTCVTSSQKDTHERKKNRRQMNYKSLTEKYMNFRFFPQSIILAIINKTLVTAFIFFFLFQGEVAQQRKTGTQAEEYLQQGLISIGNNCETSVWQKIHARFLVPRPNLIVVKKRKKIDLYKRVWEARADGSIRMDKMALVLVLEASQSSMNAGFCKAKAVFSL